MSINRRTGDEAKYGWDALRVLAVSHEDGNVRIAAAEKMIRLAYEIGTPMTRDEYMQRLLREHEIGNLSYDPSGEIPRPVNPGGVA